MIGKGCSYMSVADNPHIDRLLNASARDEVVLVYPLPDEVLGFHAQQAIEELYKALITCHGQEFALFTVSTLTSVS